MATIKFLNGTTQDIDPVRGFKMKQILNGNKEGTPEQHKFLETVEEIIFHKVPRQYSRSIKRPAKHVEPGRLPYADD